MLVAPDWLHLEMVLADRPGEAPNGGNSHVVLTSKVRAASVVSFEEEPISGHDRSQRVHDHHTETPETAKVKPLAFRVF